MLLLGILTFFFEFIILFAQKPYDQCGGKQFTGTTCCIIGYQCYKQDDYYSQCLTSCPSGWSCQQTQQSLTTPTPIGQLQYGQCGGINWNGATVCNYGLTCKKQDDFYSQCVYDAQFAFNCPNTQITTTSKSTLLSTLSNAATFIISTVATQASTYFTSKATLRTTIISATEKLTGLPVTTAKPTTTYTSSTFLSTLINTGTFIESKTTIALFTTTSTMSIKLTNFSIGSSKSKHRVKTTKKNRHFHTDSREKSDHKKCRSKHFKW